MKTKFGLPFALLALVLGLAGPVAAQEVDLVANEKAVAQAVAAKLLTEIYRVAGLSAKITPLPGARASSEVLAGRRDGETARIAAYFERNPSLVKVEPSFYWLTTGVFAKKGAGIKITDKKDLARYRVGIVRGVAHAELITQGLRDVITVDTYDNLYTMLQAGRFDLAIDESINGPFTLRALGITGVERIAEVARLELFHALTRANKDLAPRLSAAMKQLKQSGELARLTQLYEAEFQ